MVLPPECDDCGRNYVRKRRKIRPPVKNGPCSRSMPRPIRPGCPPPRCQKILTQLEMESMCASHMAARRERPCPPPPPVGRCSRAHDDDETECPCSSPVQKVCPRRTCGGRDIDEIRRAICCGRARKLKTSKAYCPTVKGKPRYKPQPTCPKDIPLRMNPPIEDRLKYVGHCDLEPPKRPCPRPLRESPCTCIDPLKSSKQKKVQYEDDCTIVMEPPVCLMSHVNPKASEKSIVSVPSPKTSGENIAAQKAEVEPKHHKPPLPPDETKKLIKPHSGIFFCPDDYVTYEEDDTLPSPRKTRLSERGKSRENHYVNTGCDKCRNCCPKKRRCPHRHQRNPCCRSKRRKCRPAHSMNADLIDDPCVRNDPVPQITYPCVPNCLREGAFETHSLTAIPCKKERTLCLQYGILQGGFNMYDNKFGAKSRGRQGLVMSVMAYCLAFHYHPKQWTTKLIDHLVDAGDTWYLQLAEKVHDHAAFLGVCEVLPYNKRQVLVLNKKRMQVLLQEPEIVGYTMSKDPLIFNLCKGLRVFFKDHRAGVLLTRVQKVVIWRDRVCYYIFDPAGRDKKAYSNFADGTAAIINVRDLEALSEILLGRSIIDNQKYVLAPVKVLKMIPETCDDDLMSEPEPTLAEKAMLGYRVLTEDTAICNADKMHLGDRSFENAKFRQAIPVAVVALTYAKISPPNTWYSKTLDKILRLGNQLYLDCLHPGIMTDLTIDNIPNCIQMGPYDCEIIIYRERMTGQMFNRKECVYNIESALEEFFYSREYNSGILDFNHYAVAIWRQKDMFYLFDPYPRDNEGKRTLEPTGKACCLMMLDTEAMADAIRANWCYLGEQTPFCIHAFKVLKLRKTCEKNEIMCRLCEDKPRRRGGRPCDGAPEAGEPCGQRLVSGPLPCGAGVAAGRPCGAPVCGPSYGQPLGTGVPEPPCGPPCGPGRALTDSPSFGGGTRFGVPRPPRSCFEREDDKDPCGTGVPICPPDEEHLGEIVSLIDSIQEDYIPKVPARYKNMPPDPEPKKICCNLDSATVSVTQVNPAWPRQRALTNVEPGDNDDPPYEPTPPVTPPPPPPPEGGAEEEEGEEEMDEEAIARRAEEEARRRAEEEEARRRAEQLPPRIPPPPPTPLSEVPLCGVSPTPSIVTLEGEGEEEQKVVYKNDVEDLEPEEKVSRHVLRQEDYEERRKKRKERKSAPLQEKTDDKKKKDAKDKGGKDKEGKDKEGKDKGGKDKKGKEDKEKKPEELTNFKRLPDQSEIIRGTSAVPEKEAQMLPFCAIMALILSYKYKIETWTKGLVTFNVDTAKKLYQSKANNFQAAPSHVIPKVKIGHQAYSANIDVESDGPTWMLEHKLNEFFSKYDRGMMTTAHYSCAFFKRNPYYLFDATTCNVMGLRDTKGQACLLRFKTVHELAARILYNKNGPTENQHFILSTICVRRLLPEARYKLPEDWDWEKGLPKNEKSKAKLVEEKKKESKEKEKEYVEPPAERLVTGYQLKDGVYRIEGSTSLGKSKGGGDLMVCLVAMLTATMLPVRNWDSRKVDTCIEKGTEIQAKAGKKADSCEKQMLKNVQVGDKCFDLNLKKIVVINENKEKRMEQYVEAVMNRLRYVIITFPEYSNVIHKSDGAYHVFSPYPPKQKKDKKSDKKDKKDSKQEPEKDDKDKKDGNAGWTRYDDLDGVYNGLRAGTKCETPDFYTFELISVKRAPKYTVFARKLSPNYATEESPNARFLRPMKKSGPPLDEKLYWLDESVPWNQSNACNSVGLRRYTPKTVWKCWNIEIPGDLYSLFGRHHPADSRYSCDSRGKQYLCTCAVALAMVRAVRLSAWTPGLLDGIVDNGDNYFATLPESVRYKEKHEMTVEDLGSGYKDMYPYSFTAKYEEVIFGFVYNILPDRFNLNKALLYFFEKHDLGLLVSSKKNLAFGRRSDSYFMYDCQSVGPPVYVPGMGGSYILRCETINRLVHCMTVALNYKKHGKLFHLYSADVKITENEGKK